MAKAIETGQTKRNTIKNLLDEFTTFQWDGKSSFDDFGMFITNNKDLKFYNGPSFSNTYTHPQFESHAGALTGVSFQTQQITFNVAAYYITDATYREIIHWLSPLKISYLIFDFNQHFRYNVKLSKINESSLRQIVGYEEGMPMYYTELTLTFDVIGKPCAIGVNPYEMQLSGNNTYKINTDTATAPDYVPSDLPTPIDCYFNFTIQSPAFGVDFKVQYGEKEVSLFNVSLQNLIVGQPLNLHYNSESGLLFLQYASSHEKLLHLVNLTDTGEKIVSGFNAIKFNIPGRLDYNDFDLSKLEFTLTSDKVIPETMFTIYPRTNLI